MPPLYVYALTDTPVMPWQEEDGRRVESLAVEGIYVVCERRSDAPPLTEQELVRQHSMVVRIANAASAVLPARFGSLVDEKDLSALLRRRSAAIAAALELVRDKVQMTLRVASAPAPATASAPTSGREYLQRRRDELAPALPAEVEAALREVRAFVVSERRTLSDRGTPAVYHLVGRADATEYRTTLERQRAEGLAISGPWPPFAFASEWGE